MTDNEEALYTMPISRLAKPETCLFKKIPLSSRTGIIAKPEKPDWESLGVVNEQIVLLPSFSTNLRKWSVQGLVDQFQWLECDSLLRGLSQSLQEPNIEGFAASSSKFYLLQRGNSKSRENGLVILPAEGFPSQSTRLEYQAWPLDPWTWTDFCFIDDQTFLFTATYEKSESTYDDGEIVGSKIGLAQIATRQITWLYEIEKAKLEGLAWDALTNRAFAITDPDDANKSSQLFILGSD